MGGSSKLNSSSTSHTTYGNTTTKNPYYSSSTDSKGNTITIGSSEGADTLFTDSILYYRRTTGGGDITRLQALKDAVTNFADSVRAKAAGQDGEYGK